MNTGGTDERPFIDDAMLAVFLFSARPAPFAPPAMPNAQWHSQSGSAMRSMKNEQLAIANCSF